MEHVPTLFYFDFMKNNFPAHPNDYNINDSSLVSFYQFGENLPKSSQKMYTNTLLADF